LRTSAWCFEPSGPPCSTRSTVPPGTFASAAALTFAAVSPVSAVCAGRCGRSVEDDDEDDEELLSVAAPASAAPPAASAETVAIMVRVFRGVVSIGLFLLWVDGLEEKIDARAGRTFGRG